MANDDSAFFILLIIFIVLLGGLGGGMEQMPHDSPQVIPTQGTNIVLTSSVPRMVFSVSAMPTTMNDTFSLNTTRT